MTFTPTQPALGRTVRDWCDELLGEYLDRNEIVELDRLKQPVAPGDDEIFLSFSASGVRPQARVEVGDELMHVWSAADNPGSFVVQRGASGTTAVAHAADTIMRVNPRWPKAILAAQLAREIRSWPTAVGAVAVGEFAVSGVDETVDLDGLLGFDVRRVLRVQRQHHFANNTSWPAVHALLERRQAATFGSGFALRFPLGFGHASVVRAAVLYGHPIPAQVDFDADLGTVYHLNDRLADAALLGVAGRLVMADEVVRTDDRSQPRPRLAEQVPPGHRLQTGQGLLQERDRLLKTEVESILNEYPPSF